MGRLEIMIVRSMEKYKIKETPVFQPGPVEPNYNDYLVFQGVVSIDDRNGQQTYLDANIAFRRACLNAIEYLKTLGYTGEQAYMLLSTAPVEGRINGIVDIPNACCTIAIPTQIFDKDIMPK